jgi:hypothetical protein
MFPLHSLFIKYRQANKRYYLNTENKGNLSQWTKYSGWRKAEDINEWWCSYSEISNAKKEQTLSKYQEEDLLILEMIRAWGYCGKTERMTGSWGGNERRDAGTAEQKGKIAVLLITSALCCHQCTKKPGGSKDWVMCLRWGHIELYIPAFYKDRYQIIFML